MTEEKKKARQTHFKCSLDNAVPQQISKES